LDTAVTAAATAADLAVATAADLTAVTAVDLAAVITTVTITITIIIITGGRHTTPSRASSKPNQTRFYYNIIILQLQVLHRLFMMNTPSIKWTL
jgi:hypothetical protein